jgi:hypothetical protein
MVIAGHLLDEQGTMKHYFAIEIGVLAGLTAALLGVPDLGGLKIVAPVVVVAWVTLQLVSSVAFCNAIHKGKIVVYQGPRGAKETYAVARGARPGWLVMRHVWVYSLIAEPKPETRGNCRRAATSSSDS